MKYSSNSMRRSSKIILFTIGVLFVALAGIILLKDHLHKPQQSNQSNRDTINDITLNNLARESVTEKPITGPYATQINKGQQYLLANLDKVGPFERLLVDYLQRKFSLNSQFNGSVKTINAPIKGQGEDPLQFKVFRRIAYPNQLVDKLPSSDDDPMSKMMMAAIYCDRIPVPSDFDKLVESNMEAGGYNLTHIELSLRLMKDNNCAYYSSQEDQQVRDKVAPLIASLITDSTTKPDLRYESIAYLMDMSRRDLIEESWIKQIISEQQLDGSWNLEMNTKDINGHTTILAIWALLEYSQPDAKATPMIRH